MKKEGRSLKDKINNIIKIPKVGWINLKKKRRALPDGAIIKAATISKKPSGNYYVSLRLEYEQEVKEIDSLVTKSIGLDFSLNSFYVSSEGEKANYPMFLHNNQDI